MKLNSRFQKIVLKCLMFQSHKNRNRWQNQLKQSKHQRPCKKSWYNRSIGICQLRKQPRNLKERTLSMASNQPNQLRSKISLISLYWRRITSSKVSLGLKRFEKCYYYQISDIENKEKPFKFAAIKNALKQENLNPEIEEKLLQLQRYQEKQMKGSETSIGGGQAHNATITVTPRVPSRKRPMPSTATLTTIVAQNQVHDKDSDWIAEAPSPRKKPMIKQEPRENIPRYLWPS